MEHTTTRTCLVAQQLCQVQISIDSKNTFTSFLQSLKDTLSGLIENLFEDKYTTVSKENESIPSELFESQEVKDLFALLGFSEENGQFIYNFSDENLSKLHACVGLIEASLIEEKTTSLGDISDSKLDISTDLSESEQNVSREEKTSSGLKSMLLAKHLKKEQSDDMMRARRTQKPRSSDFSFNTGGFFQQASSARDSKRKQCFRRELFHQQDHTTQGLGSSSSLVKRI